MNESRDIRLLSYMAGELEGNDKARVEEELAASTKLQQRMVALEALANLLREASVTGFAPGFVDRVVERTQRVEALAEVASPRFADGFADRVLGRLEGEFEEDGSGSDAPVIDIGSAIPWGFRRLAPIAAAASVALALLNLNGASEGQTPIEALLGLEPVSLETLYPVESIPTSPES